MPVPTLEDFKLLGWMVVEAEHNRQVVQDVFLSTSATRHSPQGIVFQMEYCIIVQINDDVTIP